MIEKKKVVILNGEIINVGELEQIPDGAIIEEREMVYTSEYGWREVGWQPPIKDTEILMDYVVEVDYRVVILELGL